ncbi:MAG: CpsD/CapB family tyrosine-protein kinase [Myxococcales bacterium]|nr:CpsD/CapB family tyrosine-protein kinase [Myxococcales bacterium]
MVKRGKFGDRPGSDDPLEVATRAVAPMPLTTQPMVAVRPDGVEPRSLAHTVNLADAARTAMIQAAGVPSVLAERAPAPIDQEPPEIGLTQHHLPEDRKPDPRLILHLAPDSERAAQFRVLRHHMLAAGRPQVIVVTSPGPGDGKTTTAVNLALALAECNRAKVLLVETHLRRPQLASVFAFVPPWCFAEQLAAHRHQPLLPWGMIDIPQLWLHVAAVNPKADQVQLLDAPAFAIAMERLRLGGYDHIVIDAPPVAGSAEVNLLQDAADGVLLVSRARRTTRRQLRAAIEQLSSRKVLGTVMLE